MVLLDAILMFLCGGLFKFMMINLPMLWPAQFREELEEVLPKQN
jgi:uncharacterized membrane protein (DUF373 family)